MPTQSETGKNPRAHKGFAALQNFVKTYRAALAVAVVIATAVGADYAYRSTARDSYDLGMQAMGKSNYDLAVDHFSRALRQNPADPAARFGLGWAYHSKGWLEEALKQYEQAVALSGHTLFSSHFNIGVIQQALKQNEAAAISYQRALQYNSSAAAPFYNLGLIYMEKGQHELGLGFFKKAIQSDPKNFTAQYYAGVLAEKLGRQTEATAFYQEALATNPNFAPAKEKLKTKR